MADSAEQSVVAAQSTAIQDSGLLPGLGGEACHNHLCHLPGCWLGGHTTSTTYLPPALEPVLERPSKPLRLYEGDQMVCVRQLFLRALVP